MKACALIAAAGLSSRMKQFKPLMEINGKPLAQIGIDTLHSAGVQSIVMVTGFRAPELESALCADKSITFVRNERYADSSMFDSVRIGLAYIAEHFPDAERILFYPVDVPLFLHSTVDEILLRNEPLVIPSHAGRCGHPICWNASLNPTIVKHSGENGLKGAFVSAGIVPQVFEVDDLGTSLDADTQEDFARLNALYGHRNSSPKD